MVVTVIEAARGLTQHRPVKWIYKNTLVTSIQIYLAQKEQASVAAGGTGTKLLRYASISTASEMQTELPSQSWAPERRLGKLASVSVSFDRVSGISDASILAPY